LEYLFGIVSNNSLRYQVLELVWADLALCRPALVGYRIELDNHIDRIQSNSRCVFRSMDVVQSCRPCAFSSECFNERWVSLSPQAVSVVISIFRLK